jgi:hypothetical protein
MRAARVLASMIVLGLALASASPLAAATYQGRPVDDVWYQGRCLCYTYGQFDCQIRFHGDRAFIRIPTEGIQVVGVLEDEIILDAHDIVVNDPKRGVNWSLDCLDLLR